MRKKSQLLTIQQAAEKLGVPRRRIWELVKHGQLHTEPNPLDQRSKLIELSEIERLSDLPRAPKRQKRDEASADARPARPQSQVQQPEAAESRPWPRTIGIYDGPVTVPSDQLEEYLRNHWKPE